MSNRKGAKDGGNGDGASGNGEFMKEGGRRESKGIFHHVRQSTLYQQQHHWQYATQRRGMLDLTLGLVSLALYRRQTQIRPKRCASNTKTGSLVLRITGMISLPHHKSQMTH